MKIASAYKTTTRKGSQVFRIKIDTNEILSHLEQGNSNIALDILTNKKTGLPYLHFGKSKFGNYSALSYYTWATKPKETPCENTVAVNP